MLSIKEAKEQGFTVDRFCYPHYGYKGPRFTPTEYVNIETEKETQYKDRINELEGALEDLVAWQNGPPLETYREGWAEAMEKADNLLNRGE